MPTVKKLLGILMRVFPEMTGMWDNKLGGEPTLNVDGNVQ